MRGMSIGKEFGENKQDWKSGREWTRDMGERPAEEGQLCLSGHSLRPAKAQECGKQEGWCELEQAKELGQQEQLCPVSLNTVLV